MATKNNSNTTAINAMLVDLNPAIFGAVAKDPANFAFFAALNDGEAAEEERAMRAAGIQCVVKRIGWGASVTSFKEEIAAALNDGKTPIISELVGADQVTGAIVVDHHNAYAGRPAALLQVLHLLGKTPTRWQLLVAANDSGYFPAMEDKGATAKEMSAVRAFDRKYQLKEEPYGSGLWVPKFTPEVEKAAEEAIRGMVVRNGVQILHFKFDDTAAVTDQLYETGVPQNVLILCDTGEVDYFGDWELCKALQGNQVDTKPAPWDPSQTVPVYDHFGGWTGGQSTVAGRETGFWGGYCDPKAVEDFVVAWFEK